jgi:hypothetical protein
MDIRELTAQVEHVSQGYASRFGIDRVSNWQIFRLHEEVGELTQAHLMRQGQAWAKGLSSAQIDATFRAEVADVLSSRPAAGPRPQHQHCGRGRTQMADWA